jgi:hypothetical protein
MEAAMSRPGGPGVGGGMMDMGMGLAMGQAMGQRLAGGLAGPATGQAQPGFGAPQAGFGAPAAPPPLPPMVMFHYAGPDNAQVQLSPNDIATRVRANPGGRHLCWRDGMAGWTNAADVPEIAALLRGGPPPLPPG